MSTHTVQMNTQKMIKLKQSLTNAQVRKTPPYALYQIKTQDCVITAYESGKVVFQGEGADFYAQSSSTKKIVKQTSSTTKQQQTFPQCGSDEVGTGDYFGPVTVCACHVQQEDLAWLQALKIQDSKAINDDCIRIIAPQLMERLTYSLLILDNQTYNRIHPDNNMVAIKSKLHNQAYVHLRNKLGKLPSFCMIDQFVQKSSYYRYLQKEHEVVHNILFETKAENKYIAVACGSVIARYAFLKAFDTMCEQYDFTFLKGAGAKVDENIREFVERFGEEALYKVAKVHFANTTKAFL